MSYATAHVLIYAARALALKNPLRSLIVQHNRKA